MTIRVQYAARLVDLRGEEIKIPDRSGFVEPVYKKLRESLERIGAGDDVLDAFDKLTPTTRAISVGDVVCDAAMHGDMRDPKVLVKRLDMVREIQAAERDAKPISYSVPEDLTDLRKWVAESSHGPWLKAQVCKILEEGNVDSGPIVDSSHAP